MTFQPGANLYTQGFGSRPENLEVPFIADRAPTATDVNFPIGKIWLYEANSVWYLLGQTTTLGVRSSNWIQLADADGPINSIVGTANQITASTAAGVTTLSIPAAFIAPGSIASTTTLTGGTGITATAGNIAASAGAVTASTTVTGGTGVVATTGNVSATAGAVNAGTSMTATLGNITATNGQFVGSTAGTGFLFNANAASGAAPGPVVLNSRAGQVTFTGVSIAAAADLTLTITNSEITGASTQVIYSMSGSTTGSAPSIKSVTNSAGSSAIVVTNGTGATTTTADIVLNFLVVN